MLLAKRGNRRDEGGGVFFILVCVKTGRSGVGRLCKYCTWKGKGKFGLEIENQTPVI